MTYEPRTDLVARLCRWCPFLTNPEPRKIETVERIDGLAVSDLRRMMAYHRTKYGSR